MSKSGPIIVLVLILMILPPSMSTADIRIPSSRRSRQAVQTVKPMLERAFTAKSLTFGAPVFIRIFKQSMELEVWVKQKARFTLFKTYPICTYGSKGLGPKTRRGDGRAPEGFYYVTPQSMNPVSNFYLSFNLGYPNRYDRLHQRTGGMLMVHGSCVSIGCYAMTDQGIREIYTIVEAAFRQGQPFFRTHIFPFRMSEDKMNEYRRSEWMSFWMNLKQGYDYFEKNGVPPNVVVKDKKYVFERPAD